MHDHDVGNDIVVRIVACLPTGLIRYLGVVFVPYQEYNFYFSTVSGDASLTKKMWDLSRAMLSQQLYITGYDD